MTGIIFATEEEASSFLSRYKRGRFEDLREGDTQYDDDVLVTLTGLGKIKSTLRTERFLQKNRPDRVVHPGACTALNETYEVGELIAANQVFEGDRIELAAPTYPRMPLEIPFETLPTGTLVTQDHVAQNSSERSYWQRIADMSDMTGYAVAFVAATHGIPCHILKVVTGHLDDDKQFRKNRTASFDTIADFLLDELEKLARAD